MVIFIIYIESESCGSQFIEPITYRETLKEAENFLKEYVKQKSPLGIKWSRKDLAARKNGAYYTYYNKNNRWDHELHIKKVENLELKDVKVY